MDVFSFFHGTRIPHLWDASIGEELSCREAENYTDTFAVAVMKDDNRTKDVLQHKHTCTFIQEIFIGISFHEIDLKKAKISTPRK